MSRRVATRIALIGGLAFVFTASPITAGNPFGTYHKPKCPPFCGDFFGYFPNQWRTWPVQSTTPPVAAPRPMPYADDAKTLDDQPMQREEPKKGPAPTEEAPLPKPAAARNKPDPVITNAQPKSPWPVINTLTTSPSAQSSKDHP